MHHILLVLYHRDGVFGDFSPNSKGGLIYLWTRAYLIGKQFLFFFLLWLCWSPNKQDYIIGAILSYAAL